MMLATVLGLPAEDWSAIAAAVTATVAVFAGVIALWQVLEARGLRREQAQPYVVLFAAESLAGPYVIDLVIQNFGITGATNIAVDVTPPLTRAAGGDAEVLEPVNLPSIPFLAPGQEWRTFWDTSIARHGHDLPPTHEVVVRFQDSRGKGYRTQSILDWDVATRRDVVTAYGVHDAAKALREIQRIIKGWSESGRGVKVWSRDGDARDERQRKALDDLRKSQESE